MPPGAQLGLCDRGPESDRPLGPAHLRKVRYLPALVAMRVNPALRASADRLRRAGKRPTAIIVAVLRTRLLLAWPILRSGEPYSPTDRSATMTLVAD